MKNFKHFYEGTYAKYILPGVLLQSVLIGGGYATGREIYSYGAKFGALGWISGLTIGIGFALFAFLTFEICRIYKVYDYKKRWGYHMCVGCGRCDDACPQYISLSKKKKKVADVVLVKEEAK